MSTEFSKNSPSESEIGTEFKELSREEKLKLYTELCNGKPDIFYLLSRGTVEIEDYPGVYKSGSYKHVDVHKQMSGGEAVSAAGAELHKYFPDVKIVTTSKLPENKERYSSAKAYQEELMLMGVKPEKIELQEESYSTYTEMGELLKKIVRENLQHVVVITNEFHTERSEEFFKRLKELKDQGKYHLRTEFQQALIEYEKLDPKPVVTFVAAESIKINISSAHAQEVREAKNSEAWENRVKAEQSGLEDLRKDRYWHSDTVSQNQITPEDYLKENTET